MPALDRLHGLRVVADPAALDAARWHAAGDAPVTVLRLAPDDAFAIGADTVDIDNERITRNMSRPPSWRSFQASLASGRPSRMPTFGRRGIGVR